MLQGATPQGDARSETREDAFRRTPPRRAAATEEIEDGQLYAARLMLQNDQSLRGLTPQALESKTGISASVWKAQG